MNVDCDLRSSGTVETECHFCVRRGCVRLFSSPDLHAATLPLCSFFFFFLRSFLTSSERTTGHSQRSMVFCVHTKLTDSVECSPRQARRGRTAAVTVSRADTGGRVWRKRREESQSDRHGTGGRGQCSEPQRSGCVTRGHNDTRQWQNESAVLRAMTVLVMFPAHTHTHKSITKHT